MDSALVRLFETPKLDAAEQGVIGRIERIRDNLRYVLSSVKR